MVQNRKKKKQKKAVSSRFVKKLKAQRRLQSIGPSNALDLGEEYFKSGDFENAERVFSDIISIDPNNVIALWRLGIIADQTNRVDLGVKFLKKAIAVQPEFANGYNSLGLLLHAQGKLEDALACYQRALDINPVFPEALNNLANVFHDQEEYEDAVDCYKQALLLKHDFIDAYCNLGNILRIQEAFGQAEENCQQALMLKSDYPFGHLQLGNVYYDQGYYDKAKKCYKTALHYNPHYAEAVNNLGNVCRHQGFLDEAITFYEKALSLKPDFPEAYTNLGNIYRIQGDFDSSLVCYRKVLSVRPDLALAHLHISKLKKYIDGDDQHILEMKALFSKKGLTVQQRMYLSFALAKAYEDLKEYEESFRYVQEGNKLNRSTYQYSHEQSRNLFDKIKSLFTVPHAEPSSIKDNHDTVPIFVLGMPRSGTSLVEQILASHEGVYGAGELDFFERNIHLLTGERNLEEALDKISKNLYENASQLGIKYIKDVQGMNVNENIIINKMPHNFLHIGLIHSALPGAKIIHCTRDPMDTCFSIYKNHFSGEHQYAYDQEELGRYYLLYLDLMNYWHSAFPSLIYDICYENLVYNQERETRKLLQFCELSWDNNCLSFHKTSRAVTTNSAVQVRRPIYRDSVQLWKQYETQMQPITMILSQYCRANYS